MPLTETRKQIAQYGAIALAVGQLPLVTAIDEAAAGVGIDFIDLPAVIERLKAGDVLVTIAAICVVAGGSYLLKQFTGREVVNIEQVMADARKAARQDAQAALDGLLTLDDEAGAILPDSATDEPAGHILSQFKTVLSPEAPPDPFQNAKNVVDEINTKYGA